MKIEFDKSQSEILDKLDIGFDYNDNLSDDQIIGIDEAVSDYFALHGIAKNDEVNDIGIRCESILDLLSEL